MRTSVNALLAYLPLPTLNLPPSYEEYGGLETMRNQTESTKNSATGINPTVPWRVTEVHVLSNYRLSVTFVDGTTGEIDLARLIMSDRAGVFAVLRDPTLFAQVYVEWGAVSWPGEIDLAPDAMYDELEEKGLWIPE
jgi:hypothetical protein